jgi:hypothetical protein
MGKISLAALFPSIKNKKAELSVGSSFGSSAFSLLKKTRRFPSPSHEEFGFIG